MPETVHVRHHVARPATEDEEVVVDVQDAGDEEEDAVGRNGHDVAQKLGVDEHVDEKGQAHQDQILREGQQIKIGEVLPEIVLKVTLNGLAEDADDPRQGGQAEADEHHRQQLPAVDGPVGDGQRVADLVELHGAVAVNDLPRVEDDDDEDEEDVSGVFHLQHRVGRRQVARPVGRVAEPAVQEKEEDGAGDDAEEVGIAQDALELDPRLGPHPAEVTARGECLGGYGDRNGVPALTRCSLHPHCTGDRAPCLFNGFLSPVEEADEVKT